MFSSLPLIVILYCLCYKTCTQSRQAQDLMIWDLSQQSQVSTQTQREPSAECRQLMEEKKDERRLSSFEVKWEMLETRPMQYVTGCVRPGLSEVMMTCKLERGVRGQTLARRGRVRGGGRLLWGYSLEATDRRTYRTEGWSFWSDWSGWTDTETESRVGWLKVSNRKSRTGGTQTGGNDTRKLRKRVTAEQEVRDGNGGERERERESLEKNRRDGLEQQTHNGKVQGLTTPILKSWDTVKLK